MGLLIFTSNLPNDPNLIWEWLPAPKWNVKIRGCCKQSSGVPKAIPYYFGRPIIIWFSFELVYVDPRLRMTLAEVAEHVWVIGNDGPIGEYLCWCKRKSMEREEESN